MDAEAKAERAVFLQVVGLMLLGVASCFMATRIPEGTIHITGRDVALFSHTPVREGFALMALTGLVVTFVGFALAPRWPFRARFGFWWSDSEVGPGRLERLQYIGRMPEMAWLPAILWLPAARAGLFAALLVLVLGFHGASMRGDLAFLPFVIYLAFFWLYGCYRDVRQPHWFFSALAPPVVRLWARLACRYDKRLVCVRGQVIRSQAAEAGSDAVMQRAYVRRGWGREREWVVHDRGEDFEVLTDEGQRVRVAVADAELLGRSRRARWWPAREVPDAWRLRIGICLPRDSAFLPQAAVKAAEVRLMPGDRVEVIGMRGEMLDDGGERHARQTPVLQTVAAPEDRPLLVFKARG